MRALGDYLDLTVEQARSQWGQLLRRQPRPRQEAFTPVQAVLCYGLFFVVDPHRYGGASMHRAPPIVHQLAKLFVRPPGSITNKMMNLDGSRANAGAQEWRFFVELATDPELFPHLYNVVLLAARDMGVTPEALPDFLSIEGIEEMDLLGQDELSPRTLETVIEVKAAKRRVELLASKADTMRLIEQEVRMSQHRFAGAVLDNYQYACAFCGFAPRSIPSNRLLVASHIKPWADSNDRGAARSAQRHRGVPHPRCRLRLRPDHDQWRAADPPRTTSEGELDERPRSPPLLRRRPAPNPARAGRSLAPGTYLPQVAPRARLSGRARCALTACSTRSTASFRSRCSQIRTTTQPSLERATSTRRSRSTFAASFGTQ